MFRIIFLVLVALAGVSAWQHFQSARTPAHVQEEDIFAELRHEPGVKVQLYGTEWCGYCEQTRDYLKARNIPFTDLDIETSARAKKEHAALGGKGVPLTLVGNTILKGYNPESLKAAVDKLH